MLKRDIGRTFVGSPLANEQAEIMNSLKAIIEDGKDQGARGTGIKNTEEVEVVS